MTNALAVAAVTQTLKSLLEDAIGVPDLDALGQPDVTCAPPDTLLENDETDRLNIYPWKVTHNAAFANECLPSHNSQGTRLSSPRLALDLHYVLTATGSSDLHAPILLGHGMQKLHEHPMLSSDDITDALKLTLPPAEVDLLPAAEKVLRNSDLADQFERVKITPAKTEDEELTKLWPAMNAALRMSALYKVSLVLIETERDIPEGPPVREFALTAFPLRRPTISRIVAQPGAVDAPLNPTIQPQAGTRVAILGSGFAADLMELWIGGEQIDLTAAGNEVTDQRLSIVLPATLTAGMHLARIDHFWEAETEPVRRIRETSQGGAFVLAPTVVGTPTDTGSVDGDDFTGAVAVTVTNPVGEDQSARLFLFPDDASRPRRAATADARVGPDTSLTFQFTDLKTGDYTYVLSVDGGETQAAPLTIGGP